MRAKVANLGFSHRRRRRNEPSSTGCQCNRAGSHQHVSHLQPLRGAYNINVEESDQGCVEHEVSTKPIATLDHDRSLTKSELGASATEVPLEYVQRLLDLVESNHLLEEVEVIVADGSVREVGNRCRPGPRNDADQRDTSDDGALDTVHQQHSGEDTTAEDTEPERRIPHLVGQAHSGNGIPVLGLTAGQFQRRRHGSRDGADTSAVSQSDQRQTQPDASPGSQLDRRRNRTGQPLPHPKNRQSDEHESLDEDSHERKVVRDRPGSVVSDDLISKVCIQSHSGSTRNRNIRADAHQKLAPTDTHTHSQSPQKKSLRTRTLRGGAGANTSDCRDRGCGCDDIALDNAQTQLVVLVDFAGEIFRRARTNAGSAGFGSDCGINL